MLKDIVSSDEAIKKSLVYFGGDRLAAEVFVSKYALKDADGRLLESTPEQMHRRLAREFARIEAKYPLPMSEECIFRFLDRFRYIVPQGSPMAGIGNPYQTVSLSNCFVIGGEGADSYGGVMMTDQEQVQLMKRRGGVGHDLSHIRPRGSRVNNSAMTSTGLVPFMERFSNTTREVAQEGRRGALMLSVSVAHLDAESFIDAKLEEGKITGANISVKIDDDFMWAATNGHGYTQRYPVEALVPDRCRDIDAAALWRRITHNARECGEPGVLFWDTVRRESIPDCYAAEGFATVSTNPCGEIPLCPYDSCRLIAVNLLSMVKDPWTLEADVDWALLDEVVKAATRLGDDLVDLEEEKVDAILRKIESDPESDETKRCERNLWLKIKDKSVRGRRMGIGITGLADMIAALGMGYGTVEAATFAATVQRRIALAAYRESVEMAGQRGAFPIYNAYKEEGNPMIERIRYADAALHERMVKVGRRNIALLTIAPAGSISLLTRTTSGMEPLFAYRYTRRRKVSETEASTFSDGHDHFAEYTVIHPGLVEWAAANGFDRSAVENDDGGEAEKAFRASPFFGHEAHSVNWRIKVRMQGMLQKWVDHSISDTVNLPADISEDEVRSLYEEAWKCGCKGITVYRDGSRTGVLVKDGTESGRPKSRPVTLEADIVRFRNGNEEWAAFIGVWKGTPYEIFTGCSAGLDIPPSVTKGSIMRTEDNEGRSSYDFIFIGKDGEENTINDIASYFDGAYSNYAKLISGVMRLGMKPADVVDLVETLNLDSDTVNTWKNGVKRAIRRYIPDGTMAGGKVCPHCGGRNFAYQDGCPTCRDCGWTACG